MTPHGLKTGESGVEDSCSLMLGCMAQTDRRTEYLILCPRSSVRTLSARGWQGGEQGSVDPMACDRDGQQTALATGAPMYSTVLTRTGHPVSSGLLRTP